MSSRFKVVEFLSEGSVAAVPDSWVEFKDGTLRCYWPLDKSSMAISKRVEKYDIPDKDAWNTYEIAILSTCDDYETARRRAKRAEETSDLSSEMELSKRKPKRNRVRYPSSSEDDDCWRNVCVGSQNAKQKGVQSYTPGPTLPLAPDVGRSSLFSGATFSERQGDKLSDVASISRTLLMKLDEVVETQKQHTHFLQYLLKGKREEPNEIISMEDLLENPLETVDQLRSFCSKLRDSERLRNKLVSAMIASGGQNVGDSVRRITRKIGTPSLWSNFNMKGRKNKCSFEKLTLYSIIMKVCRKLHPHAIEKDVDYQLAETLKHYPSRQGGYRFHVHDLSNSDGT